MPLPSDIHNPPQPHPTSLWHMLNAAATAHADRPAVTAMHQSASHLFTLISPSSTPPQQNGHTGDCLSWTYTQLRHASLRIASGLLASGVKRGDTIVTLFQNGVESELLLWVASTLQLRYAPLDVGLLSSGRREQLVEYLGRLKPDVVWVGDAQGAGVLDEALGEHVVRMSSVDTGVKGWNSLERLGSMGDPNDPAVTQQNMNLEADGARIAAVLFTSGTSSGRPKGCPLSVTNVINASVNEGGIRNMPQTAMIQSVNFRAISHILSMLSFASGRHLVMPAASFSAKTSLDAMERFTDLMVICIPVQLRLFAQDPTFKGRDASTLKRLFLGGDMVTTDQLKQAQAMFPHTIVETGHGMTEACSVLGWRCDPERKVIPEHHGILATGVPDAGVNVRICSQERNIVPRGEAGELLLGGLAPIKAYLDDEQPEAFHRDEHGVWLKTGDRAFMDDTGAVFIIGRIKDIIKKMGIPLSPAVIESVLNAVDGVQAAVLGMPSEDFGEVPVAVVRQKTGVDLQQIVVEKLGPDHALQSLFTLEEIGLSESPVNATGKVVKFALREAIEKSRNGS